MTTKHFHDFKEFEEFASKQPLGTQYHVFKVAPDGIGVKIYEPDQGKANQGWTAAAFADVALGDPSMKCVATGVTEFGTTGTVVPRMPQAPECVCWWCNKPGATMHIVDPIGPGKDWMHDSCYWEVNKLMMD